jgi:hypothetical protein
VCPPYSGPHTHSEGGGERGGEEVSSAPERRKGGREGKWVGGRERGSEGARERGSEGVGWERASEGESEGAGEGAGEGVRGGEALCGPIKERPHS